MTRWRELPCLQPMAIFLIALSLSIGWGIRGNFGHESGAMLAGVLASVAACLMSAREDWRRKVAFFAFFGGLGWGFGGSISYMYPISFAGSEQWQTCIYGFYATFLVGLLWAGLGGMGASLAAVMDRQRLQSFMVPVLFVLTVMGISNLLIQPWLENAVTVPETVYLGGSFFRYFDDWSLRGLRWLPSFGVALAVCLLLWRRIRAQGVRALFILAGAVAVTLLLCAGLQVWLANTRTVLEAGTLADMRMDSTWNRHQSPLYWYDADWFPALAALIGVCLFDLWDRRFAGWSRLVLLGGAGAAVGAVIYRLFSVLGVNMFFARLLVVIVGDPYAVNPETGTGFHVFSFLSNWPNFAHYYPQHLGWLLGLGVGAGVYFYFWGKWRRDSRLLLYLACGWLLAFLIMPVLGSIPLQFMGGFRLTPPRSDDWAGILGVFIAAMAYCLRYNLGGVALGGTITGILGGFSFAVVPFLRALLRLPGHPGLTPGGTPASWVYYQSANWHSIMEQMHGFGHGIALAIALGVLAVRLKPQEDKGERRRWTEFAAIVFVLFFITLMNVFKNVEAWKGMVPESMKMPLVGMLEFSAATWFLLTWCALAVPVIVLMALHLRRPLPIVPDSWTARGQALYLAFLWIIVVANFERALVGFHESRLVTEWVIILNASLASFLIVALPQKPLLSAIMEPESWTPLLKPWWKKVLPAALCALLLMALMTRLVYGNVPLESSQVNHKRWGAQAQWRIKPILKHGQHR
ncbi:MAG: hypothetical protein GXY07_10295 [Candidatus Hydrogenedentes bacterium]|nr:hypothetical protein [Candidatus Hydrogenedentota bacterium]